MTKYPGVRRLSNGKFEIRVKIINPKTGKEKDVKRVVDAASAAEAVVLREQLRQEVQSGDTTEERMRLGEYAISWMRGKLPTLKPSTARRYAETIDLHIAPFFGDYYLDAITPLDVTKWRDAQTDSLPSTVNSRLRVLRTLLADATQDLGLHRDPAARVRARREKRPEDDPNVLDARELGAFLLAARDMGAFWYALFLLMALTGMRFGEASSLKWSDVDETNKLIHVRRSHWQGIVAETKTGSRRTVPLPDVLAQALRELRRHQIAKQAPGLDEGWVFPSSVGTLLRTASVQQPLRRALAAADIEKRLTPHGLRRTFNNLTRQFAAGEVVRAMTGHVTEAMTFHYSHVELREKQEAVDKVLATVAAQVEGWVEGRSDGSETAG